MKILVNVKAHKYLNIDILKPFQGDLKKLDEINFNKLRGEIIDDGFNFAPHVWKCDKHWYILDGHQRIHVLSQILKEGYELVDKQDNQLEGVPVNVVDAEDINSAKRKVLQAVSQYGKIDNDGFRDFTVDIDFDLSAYDFPDFNAAIIDHGDVVDQVNQGDETAEWAQADLDPIPDTPKDIKLTILFNTEDERESFVENLDLNIIHKHSGQYTCKV